MRLLKQTLKRLFSGTAQLLLKLPGAGSFVDRLAYERRRHLRRQCERRLRERGLYGDEVIFGPFQGLKYTSEWASSRFEKMLGAYEAELHPAVERVCRTPYADVIVVGSAEGYYVTGLARRMAGTTVHAYDINPAVLAQCRRNAELNGVLARVKFGAACDCQTLQTLPLAGRTFLLCDCEGYEMELLDPAKAPRLAEMDILVEIHDFINPAISRTLRERFAATHEIEVISSRGLDYENYPALRQLNFNEIYAMVGEERYGLMDWFFLRAKSGPPRAA
ncbi:MAG: hypothetical protein HZA89_00880 [Verrucomicrobia bacterium]|nr:hypothetical protein [Verrucomicrobiota bacterium]